ncbi:terminase large subunit domain-containing protein [Thalassospira marina]|uniref:Oxidoreductase n=1 Tax=Thalassospira marina TaxID=2048283 RepID=A0A2N3KWT2_9PROT|nr:terminase family protein [Thalassospira marina]PKR55041.1 oxidoreductase [Thalassospira marina]
MKKTVPDDDNDRISARNLYWQGYSCAEISRRMSIPYGTVDAWKRRDQWDDASPVIRIDSAIDTRLQKLISKEDKTDKDYREIENLSRVLERTARIRNYGKTGKEADLNPNIDKRNEAKHKKAKGKNALTEEQVEQLVDAFEKGLFRYQVEWAKAKKYRERNILKSRQIGATWYFAREALIDAITTGDNQIFLSASKAQAHVFKEYIIAFVRDVTDVELKGDPITLWNGATLYFLGTNSKTAQSYHGHVYLDEYAWISKFLEFRKVASAMATHKKWRKTYFSTPSTINHDAYTFWSGASFNKGKAKANRVEFDVSHMALRHGAKGPDGQWRQIVTVIDAEEAGCDLFDINQLHLEYNDQDFANLFMGEWVDDTASYFTFDELRRCLVDSWEEWEDDFSPHGKRPYGSLPVWIGYDPSESGDHASIVVVAPPKVEGGKFRVLEKMNVVGTDFHQQAEVIRQLTQRYNVTHIGIDTTTIGKGVFEMVRAFYPAAVAITYSVEVKSRMVLKAKQLISKAQIEFDSGWSDVCMAFMSIRKTSTPSGRQQTFIASRSKETGHADVAWAIMHAIDKLDFLDFTETGADPSGNTNRQSIMEIF